MGAIPTVRFSSLVILVAFSLLPVVVDAGSSDPAQEVEAAFRDAKWTKGPAVTPLLGVADLKLPEGFGAVSGEDARRISEAMHNPARGRDLSMVFSGEGNWFLMFDFEDIGFVKDDEKGSLDADAILNSIREGTEAANKERAKQGWPPVKVVGWDQRPHFDEQTKNLTWAVRGESEGRAIINYDTRILGRRGVMRVKLVSSPEELPQAVTQFRTLLAGYSFTKGNRYAEWTQGDKVAAIGLTALITGGAAAVVVKSGLGKTILKILGVVALGGLGFLGKLFKRNKTA
jgi:uncharacterized membrane-anchored protein